MILVATSRGSNTLCAVLAGGWLWALCETAFFAVLQAPVGALFASMGALASMAPGAGPGHDAFG